MSSCRNFLQQLATSVIAFPLLPAEACVLNENTDETKYDGPLCGLLFCGLGSYGTRVAEAMKDWQTRPVNRCG